MSFPKKYGPGEAPPSVLALTHELLPRLLEGDHAALAVLREQCRNVRIGEVELTGVGFFADLIHPEGAPIVEPSCMAGGDAVINVAGVEHGAGCVLFVEAGLLSMLEVYTFGDDEWAEDAVIRSVDEVTPIQPVRRGPASPDTGLADPAGA